MQGLFNTNLNNQQQIYNNQESVIEEQNQQILGGTQRAAMAASSLYTSNIVRGGGVHRAEGPLVPESSGLLYNLQQQRSQRSGATSSINNIPSMGASMFGIHAPQYQQYLGVDNPFQEFAAADMNLSTMYLHELHYRQVRTQGHSDLFNVVYSV